LFRVIGFHRLRHVAVHSLQRIDVLLQAENLPDGVADFGERLFHGKVLIPVLQQIGELAFGQGQTSIDFGDPVSSRFFRVSSPGLNCYVRLHGFFTVFSGQRPTTFGINNQNQRREM